MVISLQKEIKTIKTWSALRSSGRVTHIIGLLIESVGPSAYLGELCYVYNRDGQAVPCEVVGFKENKVLLMSLGEMALIAPGAEVYPTGEVLAIPVAESMCGRVLDAMGHPIDGKGPIIPEKYYPVTSSPPHALHRSLITEVLETGIKAIDATCTLGRGQRVGIFSGAGVGKSILLGMIAKASKADINVIALIGERGREVREFIERDLGSYGLARSVVVVVTSDQAALLRTKGAHAATAIAEFFRDLGRNVIFMMDSISRYAMALREIGLAVGEPPTTRGYTPSVFALLPKLLERAGTADKGVITGIYTILVSADEMNDPVPDTTRALLDGHIVLARRLASANHYPAIDVLESLSRVMVNVVSKEAYDRATRLRGILQVYKEAEDLINIGAYVPGSNPEIDEATRLIVRIRTFLKQGMTESYSYEDTQKLLRDILGI
jgi:flagellum-specific ATP synthase